MVFGQGKLVVGGEKESRDGSEAQEGEAGHRRGILGAQHGLPRARESVGRLQGISLESRD